MKTTVSVPNFFINNTPRIAQIIGDISLVLAVIAGIPLVLQQAGMAVPSQLTVVATWAVAGGAIVKFVSKTFGVVTPDTTQESQSTTTQTPN